jgi:hypothetical protein
MVKVLLHGKEADQDEHDWNALPAADYGGLSFRLRFIRHPGDMPVYRQGYLHPGKSERGCGEALKRSSDNRADSAEEGG